MNKYLVVVGGATASGKTELAIKIAQHFDTVILSCDSRQFYREMNIGTAKPTEEELAAVPHYFVDSLSVKETYSVGDYEKDALHLLKQLYQEKEIVVLVGGSGLFIQAVCEGFDQFPEVPITIQEAVEADYKEHGLLFLQKELQRIDPVYYQQVDQNNPRRLMRAISVYRASGQAFSSFQNQTKIQRNFQPIYLLLEWERAALYERINLRVDQMLATGLEQEARELLPYRSQKALQTVGYQEFFQYFDQEIDYQECIRLIKRNTRRYAKRQMTWFRRSSGWKRFDASNLQHVLPYLESVVK